MNDRLMRFVLEMRQAGVTHARVLAALEQTPRADYAPAHLEGLAMDDINLPLAHAEAMTKPSVIARMLAALDPQAGDHVLEVGTGSGYQAAALARLAEKVTTLERWRDLAVEARVRLGTARLMQVCVHAGDGWGGWAAGGPYDRIIVNASAPDIPPALAAQLKPGGVLVIALGEGEAQRLIRLCNDERSDLGPVRFAPLGRGVEG